MQKVRPHITVYMSKNLLNAEELTQNITNIVHGHTSLFLIAIDIICTKDIMMINHCISHLNNNTLHSNPF